MKRLISVLLCISVMLGLFTGCSDKDSATHIIMQGDINSASVVHLMEKTANGEAKLNYTYETAYTTQRVIARLGSGDADIAIAPANVAATIYNKMRGKVTLYGLVYTGDFYLLENGSEIKALSDLKGKEIHLSTRNSAIEYMLLYILKKNGVAEDEVTFSYAEDEAALTQGLVDGSIKIAACTQGVKSVAMAKNTALRSVKSLKTEWDFISDKSGYVEGCIIVPNYYIDKNKSSLKKFLKEIEEAVNLVKADIDASAKLCVKHEIFEDEKIAKSALKASDISFVSGNDMKAKAKDYINALHSVGMKSMGQKAPGSSFYYGAD